MKENHIDSAYLESTLRCIMGIGPAQTTQDAQRRQARLAKIIADLFKDTCYEHGEMCQIKPECWAKEIISRALAWA